MTLTSVVLLSLAAADATVVSAPELSDGPRAVLYTYPSSTLAFASRRVVEGENAYYVPVGLDVRLTERTSLELELAGAVLTTRFQSPGWLFAAAVGPSIQLIDAGAFKGLFVAPRFRLQLFRPVRQTVVFFNSGNEGPVDFGAGVARAFMAEIDVGFQWHFGRVYLAPVIGVGVGYAYDYDDSTGVKLLSPFTRPSNATRRPQGFVWSLNLNLARLGAVLGRL